MIFRFKGVIFRSLPLVFGGVFADEKGEETEKNWEMMRLECQGERLVLWHVVLLQFFLWEKDSSFW